MLIGFAGDAATFPVPGGTPMSLVRATVSDPDGRNARSWSADPANLASLKAQAVGTGWTGPEVRFSFSVGSFNLSSPGASYRMLDIPLRAAAADSPGVDVVPEPWGGTLIVDKAKANARVWIEVTVAFDDRLDGQPAHIDATCGFWLVVDPEAPPP